MMIIDNNDYDSYYFPLSRWGCVRSVVTLREDYNDDNR